MEEIDPIPSIPPHCVLKLLEWLAEAHPLRVATHFYTYWLLLRKSSSGPVGGSHRVSTTTYPIAKHMNTSGGEYYVTSYGTP
jgi:hypothetical protein